MAPVGCPRTASQTASSSCQASSNQHPQSYINTNFTEGEKDIHNNANNTDGGSGISGDTKIITNGDINQPLKTADVKVPKVEGCTATAAKSTACIKQQKQNVNSNNSSNRQSS